MKKIDKYIASLPCITNKKVIITGANSGLGFAIADHCLTKGASIVMACRNIKKAQEARDNLLVKHENAKIDIVFYDQSTLERCKTFAKEIIVNHSDFYALVLNAGVLRVNKGVVTKDGFPMVAGINSFGLLAIVNELQSFLKQVNEEKRIVIQGSLAARMEKYKTFENFVQNPNRPYFEQYANSKNVSFNIYTIYGRNNQNKNVKYLQCEPGISASNIIQNFPKWIKGICAFFFKLLFQSCREGSLPAMDVICNDVDNLTHSAPKHLWTTRGLPKRIKVKEKHIHEDVLNKMLEIVNR